MSEAERLLTEALNLPDQDRADLAVRLLESLDGHADDDVDATWVKDIERRCVTGSSAKSSDGETARRFPLSPLPGLEKSLRSHPGFRG